MGPRCWLLCALLWLICCVLAGVKASAILLMMSKIDQEEEEESDGTIQNGATTRVLLALRHVLFTNSYTFAPGTGLNPDLRVVVQMSNPSEYVDAACFAHDNGSPVVIPVDLTKFSNALMFNCAASTYSLGLDICTTTLKSGFKPVPFACVYELVKSTWRNARRTRSVAPL